jgi:hypothetical protein
MKMKTKKELEERVIFLEFILRYERFEHRLIKIGLFLFIILSFILAILLRGCN